MKELGKDKILFTRPSSEKDEFISLSGRTLCKGCLLSLAHISVQNPEGSQSERYANRASETQPDERGPQSQSLSRSYGSNLPTSLTYIVLVTRGCSPWRPDADIGTARHENHRLSLGFARARKGVPGTTREYNCNCLSHEKKIKKISHGFMRILVPLKSKIMH
ncbi:uncharacterized protein NPIL_412861 [Nephila pilipes]|uniref:Uncharacterized protein n=1 Tax=Nephila pilipes TaxID=299642 RepID=A0A8X6TB07_NEPPI|nr:uncharacterized protein NPIL_412861 [Nephila pilipes]